MMLRRFWFAIIVLTLLLIGTWVVLLMYYHAAESRMQQAADLIESIGDAKFFVEADINDTMPVKSSIRIPVQIPVLVSMSIMVDVPITMDVAVNNEMKVPFDLTIKQIVPVDTFFQFPDPVSAYVNDSLSLASKLKIRLWPGFNIPFSVKGEVPMQQGLIFSMQSMRISADIPIAMRVQDSIPVHLDMNIPIQEHLQWPMMVNSKATITFYEELPIEAMFPIHLKVPVEVDFSKTPLQSKFDSLGNIMRKVL